MAKNFRDFARDLSRRMTDVERTIRRDVPVYLAVAWERMKDANFSAQGFVRGGTANPRWPPRKKETHLSKVYNSIAISRRSKNTKNRRFKYL